MPLRPLVGHDTEFGDFVDHARQARTGSPRLVVLYGRRRVGKTFLVLHLLERLRAEGMAAVYFAATEQAEPVGVDEDHSIPGCS